MRKFNLLYKQQIGFRSKIATKDALVSVIEHIRLRLKNKMKSVEFFLDLKKVYDTLNHQMSLQMLQNFGIRGFALVWFENSLSNRRQVVKNCNTVSDQRDFKC